MPLVKTGLATSPVPSIRPGWPLKCGVFLAVFSGAVGPLVLLVMACVVPAVVALVTLLATTEVVWLAVFLVTYRFVFLSFGGIFASLPL